MQRADRATAGPGRPRDRGPHGKTARRQEGSNESKMDRREALYQMLRVLRPAMRPTWWRAGDGYRGRGTTAGGTWRDGGVEHMRGVRVEADGSGAAPTTQLVSLSPWVHFIQETNLIAELD